MKRTYQIFARRLLGVRRERMVRGMLLCALLFGSLWTAGFRVEIASPIKGLMVCTVTGGAMWKALLAKDMEEDLRHLFSLPADERGLAGGCLLAIFAYVFFLRTGPLLAVLSAVCPWKKGELLLCAVCVLPGVFAPAGVRFLVRKDQGVYAFCPKVSGTKERRLPKSTGRLSIQVYLFRYLMAHRNYLVNTAALWGVAMALPFFLGMLEAKMALPMGFALLSLNTPLEILLSCDPSLERMVRLLPGQKKAFFLPYGMLLFGSSFFADGIYLVSWALQKDGVTGQAALLALWYSLQTAAGAAFLEYRFPIRGYRVESDLWRHPRKYVLPGILLLETMVL